MDHFVYKNRTLHAEDVAVAHIAEEVGTPFYCYSTATLQRHYTVFGEQFAGLEHLICYAVKANSNLAVLKTLGDMGSGADVVSAGEILRARKAGIPAHKIVFSGVAKTRDEMTYALQEGILQFNVESAAELEQLNDVAQSMGKIAPIAIRVNPDVDPKTHAKISTGQKESKFGIEMPLAKELYAHAASLPGIAVQGVSVHIGSQLLDLTPFRHAFTRVAAFVRALKADDHSITELDLGGGFGIRYGDNDTTPELAEYAAIVQEATEGLGCRLIFEPGRMIVGNAGILVSRVIYTKQGSSRRFLILDAGMNDLIRPSMYGAYHDIIPVAETLRTAEMLPHDVVGPVCETGDIFAEKRILPTLAPDDLVAFRSAGAYGAVMSNSYNTRPLLPEVLVDGDSYRTIRKRQSVEELLAAESM